MRTSHTISVVEEPRLEIYYFIIIPIFKPDCDVCIINFSEKVVPSHLDELSPRCNQTTGKGAARQEIHSVNGTV